MNLSLHNKRKFRKAMAFLMTVVLTLCGVEIPRFIVNAKGADVFILPEFNYAPESDANHSRLVKGDPEVVDNKEKSGYYWNGCGELYINNLTITGSNPAGGIYVIYYRDPDCFEDYADFEVNIHLRGVTTIIQPEEDHPGYSAVTTTYIGKTNFIAETEDAGLDIYCHNYTVDQNRYVSGFACCGEVHFEGGTYFVRVLSDATKNQSLTCGLGNILSIHEDNHYSFTTISMHGTQMLIYTDGINAIDAGPQLELNKDENGIGYLLCYRETESIHPLMRYTPTGDLECTYGDGKQDSTAAGALVVYGEYHNPYTAKIKASLDGIALNSQDSVILKNTQSDVENTLSYNEETESFEMNNLTYGRYQLILNGIETNAYFTAVLGSINETVDLYSIKYYEGEELYQTDILKKGTDATLPEFTKTGFTFNGWKENSELVESITDIDKAHSLFVDLTPSAISFTTEVSTIHALINQTYTEESPLVKLSDIIEITGDCEEGNVTFGVEDGALPGGLSFNINGTIMGTPTQLTTDSGITAVFTVKGKNGATATDRLTITFFVDKKPGAAATKPQGTGGQNKVTVLNTIASQEYILSESASGENIDWNQTTYHFIGTGNNYTLEGLNDASTYYIHTRTISTDTTLSGAVATSDPIYTNMAKPAETAFSYDKDSLIISFDNSRYAISSDANFSQVLIDGSQLSEQKYYVKTLSDGLHPDSESIEFTALYNLYEVVITNLFKDDELWKDTSVTLKNDERSYNLSYMDGYRVSVRKGIYNIYVNGLLTDFSVTITENLTYDEAINFYTLKLYDDNELLTTQLVEAGHKANQISDIDKAGYDFVKWIYTDTKADYSANDLITKPTILKAVWTAAATSIDCSHTHFSTLAKTYSTINAPFVDLSKYVTITGDAPQGQVRYAIAGGSLPDGLMLTEDGKIYGKPIELVDAKPVTIRITAKNGFYKDCDFTFTITELVSITPETPTVKGGQNEIEIINTTPGQEYIVLDSNDIQDYIWSANEHYFSGNGNSVTISNLKDKTTYYVFTRVVEDNSHTVKSAMVQTNMAMPKTKNYSFNYEKQTISYDSNNYTVMDASQNIIPTDSVITKYAKYYIFTNGKNGYGNSNPLALEMGDPSEGDLYKKVSSDIGSLDSDTSYLKSVILTEEDINRVQNGANVSIRLNVENVTTSPTISDQIKVEENQKNNKIAGYYDINIYKQVADSNEVQLYELGGKIKISIPLDKKYASNKYNYTVLRLHRNEAEYLPAEYDEATGKITFETDKFSTYVIMYNDAAPTDVNTSHNFGVKTRRSFVILLYLSMTTIAITITRIKKKIKERVE